jgi:hypothetical protein
VERDLDIILQPSAATSLGLNSMRERAELTGAASQSSPSQVKGQPFGVIDQSKLRLNIKTAVPLNSLRYNPLLPEKLLQLSSFSIWQVVSGVFSPPNRM